MNTLLRSTLQRVAVPIRGDTGVLRIGRTDRYTSENTVECAEDKPDDRIVSERVPGLLSTLES